jgi:hypothetical protein
VAKQEHHYRVTFTWRERAEMAASKTVGPAVRMARKVKARVRGWWRRAWRRVRAALLAFWGWVVGGVGVGGDD